MSEQAQPPASRPYSGPPAAVFRLISAAHAFLYRLTSGKLGGRIGKGPILLLETIGRASGKRRMTPLLYVADGDRLVVIASKSGAPRHQDWWLNLERNPRAQVQVGRRRMTVQAEEVTGPERERLWARLLEIYPSYQDYQRRTARQIPVIVLQPTAS